jgi:hypothetical protein
MRPKLTFTILLIFNLSITTSWAKPSFPEDKTLSAFIGAGISGYNANQFAFDPRIGLQYSIPMFYENIRFDAIVDLSPRYFFAPKYSYYTVDTFPLASKSNSYQAKYLGGIQIDFGIMPVIHFKHFYFGITPIVQYNYIKRNYDKQTYDLVSKSIIKDTSFVNAVDYSSLSLYLTAGIEKGRFKFAIVGDGSSIYATVGVTFINKPMRKIKVSRIQWE